jgi:lysine/ornithine N-monooxygenase
MVQPFHCLCETDDISWIRAIVREPLVDERDRHDYFTPSMRLFSAHCNCVVHRYGLGKSLIKQETVHDISYNSMAEFSEIDKFFAVRTNRSIHYAKAVVLAVGPGNKACIPGLNVDDHIEGACHTMQITKFPDPTITLKMKARKSTHIVVVGGGLTSAQIIDLAIRKGVTKVWHIMRSGLKVKPFDVDIEWMGKFRNHQHAIFWSANTDEERLEMILKARNGGSLTRTYRTILDGHVRDRRLSQHTYTTLASQSWNPETRTWRLKTSPSILELEMTDVDYIYYATGITPDVNHLPYLQTMQADYPIQTHGGFPCLNDDLMWKDDVPLFVTGRLAALRLGPGAANLGGCRSGAERVVWSLEQLFANRNKWYETKGKRQQSEKTEDDGYCYCTGTGNRFDRLFRLEDENEIKEEV